MRRIKAKRVILCLAVGFASPCVWAGDKTTSAAFLKIPVGARAVGLGSGFTAMANDATAIHWNAAGLAQLSRREITALYAQHIADTNFSFLGYAHPLGHQGSGGALVLSYISLRSDPIEGRDATGKKTGSFTTNDMAVNLAYGRSLGKKALGGLTVKVIRETLADESAKSMAMDVGLVHKLPLAGLRHGISVQNIGPGLKFLDERHDLPLTISEGMAYTFWTTGVTMAIGMSRSVHEKNTTYTIGTEYSVGQILALRGRYALANQPGEVSKSGELADLAAGFGVKIRSYQLDYGFVPFADFGGTHRVSLTARFGPQ